MIKKVACGICVLNNSIILQSTKSGEFVFPGGKFEENESSIECLIREMKEETDLNIRFVFLCGVDVYKDWPFELHSFLCIPEDITKFKNVEPDKHLITQLYDLNKLPQLTESNLFIFNKYSDKINLYKNIMYDQLELENVR